MRLLPSFQLAGIAAAIALIAGGLGGYKLGAGRWESRYTALESKGWERQALYERAARVALQERVAALDAILSRNDEVIRDLQSQTRSIDADRAHLRRMLEQATRAAACRDSVPEAASQPGAAGGAPDAGNGILAGLAEEALSECRANTERHRALIRQIRPQL